MTEQEKDFFEQSIKYRTRRKIWGVLGWIFIAIAGCCLVGLVVGFVLLAIKLTSNTVSYIISGSCLGGIALFGALAYFSMRLSVKAEAKENDCRERAHGEECFLLGEDTFSTFLENGLQIEGEAKDKIHKKIFVPYSQMRFFSVCTRHSPRDKGEMSVVMEIPAHYLSSKKTAAGVPPALIQAEAKERLFACIENHGLTVLGERERTKSSPKRIKKFTTPNLAKRKTATFTLIISGVALVGGIAVAFWELTLGSIFACLGIYGALRGGVNLWKANYGMYVYSEGLFWKDVAAANNVYVTWKEIETISLGEEEGTPCLKAKCLYGEYHFPVIDGIYEYLKENAPSDKVK